MNFYISLSTLRLLAALLLAALLVTLLPAADAVAQDLEPASVYRAEINAQLAADLQIAAGPVSFLVVLRDQPDPRSLLAAGELQGAAAVDRRAALYAELTAHAARTQAPLRAWLDARNVPYTPHYLANMIEVHGDAALAEQLRLRPEVDRLSRNPAVRGADIMPFTGPAAQPAFPLRSTLWPEFTAPAHRFQPLAPAAADAPTADLPYGLTYTNADEVWALGFRGAGVVIASQDTGVRWDHPALRRAYRGFDAQAQTANHVYNWFDAFGRNSQDTQRGCSVDPQVPCDDGSHGTHTVGTMVGDATPDGGPIIGMAPDAEWIGCRNMRGGVGTPASYTTCFEWFIAPYPQGGDPFADGKPELAPDIINNSWGCPPSEGCDTGTLQQIVDTVRAAGLMVVASAGNEGLQTDSGQFSPFPQCRSVRNPIALYDSVFTVGAHSSNGQIANFSSRGPVTIDGSNRLKPDLTAPGMFTYSSTPNGYGQLSGTSMASPHVAGAVALLWSAVPALKGDIDLTEQILIETATPVLDDSCDPGGAPKSPNNVYGYGRLDVLAALTLAQQPVTLTLSLASSGLSDVSGQTLQLVELRTNAVYSGLTGADGKVTWDAGTQSILQLGTYAVQAPGCIGSVVADTVRLAPGDTVQRDITVANTFCVALPQVSKR
jgi:subtilisin family serine protease